MGLVSKEDTTTIPGTGVNLLDYQPAARDGTTRKIPVVIMAARLLWDQGLAEFINAAWEIKNKGIPARFLLAGAPDPGNLASASEAELDEWRTEGVVEWSFHP